MYVLVLKDDFSGYAWLSPTSPAFSSHAAETLARWQRVFSAPDIWVSDKGSHFMKTNLQELTRDHRIAHRPRIA